MFKFIIAVPVINIIYFSSFIFNHWCNPVRYAINRIFAESLSNLNTPDMLYSFTSAVELDVLDFCDIIFHSTPQI